MPVLRVLSQSALELEPEARATSGLLATEKETEARSNEVPCLHQGRGRIPGLPALSPAPTLPVSQS